MSDLDAPIYAHASSHAILPPNGSVPALALARARVTAAHAAVSRMVGMGCHIEIPSLDAVLAIHLAGAADVDVSQAIVLKCGEGVIQLAEGARLLRALTGIDADAFPSQDEKSRKWLDAAIVGRLGATPFACCDGMSPDNSPAFADPMTLSISLKTASHALSLHACAEARTWQDFLSRTEWKKEQRAQSDYLGLPIRAKVLIARHDLPAVALQALAEGDVILPDSPRFDAEGSGLLNIGGIVAAVRYEAPGALRIVDLDAAFDLQEEAGGAS